MCFSLFRRKISGGGKIVRQIIELARENSDDTRLTEYLMFAGRIWQEVGDTEAAEQAYLDSLKSLDENRGEDRETIALIYNNLSQLYADSGELAKADEVIQRSLKLTAGIAHENPDAFTKNLNNASALYFVIGDVSRAVSYMELALTELWEQGLWKSILYASILTHLSMLKLRNEEIPEAIALITEALIIFEEQKEGREYATALNAFGMIVLALGDMALAERAFRESIEVLEKIQGFDSHPNTNLAKGNLAFTYFWQEKYEEAEKQYVEILGTSDKRYAKAGLIDTENLFLRGLGLLALGKPEQSLQCLEQSVASSECFIDNAFAFSTESQRMQVLAESTKNFYALLSLVRAKFIQNLEVVQRMLSVVLRRKALGIEALVIQREMVMSGQYPHLARALHELTTLQQKIAGLLLRPPDEDSEDLDRQLREAEARRIDIEANLARQIPEIRLTQKLREVDYAKIANILPEGSVLIEFVGEQKIVGNPMPALKAFSSPHYTAFVIPAKNPNGIKLFDLGTVEEINQLIQHFLYRITKKGEFDKSGQQLYAKLIEPWINEIGENRKFFLSPDGELNRLPFEALPLNDEQRFIDKYLTVYVGSGRDLLRHQMKSGAASTKSLVVANPDFDLEVKTGETLDSKFSHFHGLLSQKNLNDFPLDSLGSVDIII